MFDGELEVDRRRIDTLVRLHVNNGGHSRAATRSVEVNPNVVGNAGHFYQLPIGSVESASHITLPRAVGVFPLTTTPSATAEMELTHTPLPRV